KLSNCHIKIRLHISKAFKLNIPIIGMVYKFFYPGYGDDLIPPSFPTRRSSDLSNPLAAILPCVLWALHGFPTNKTTTATGRKRFKRFCVGIKRPQKVYPTFWGQFIKRLLVFVCRGRTINTQALHSRCYPNQLNVHAGQGSTDGLLAVLPRGCGHHRCALQFLAPVLGWLYLQF